MTQNFPIDRRTIVLSALFMFLIVMLAGAAGVYILSDKSLKQALVFVNFTLQLEENYPGQLDWNRLYITARDAMFEQLDRYSGFIETDQFEQLDEELSGSYSGIGVSVVRHDRGLLIMSVRENSPAAEVGLLSGDIIIEADDVLLAGLTSDKSTRLLRGEEGTSVKIAAFRPVLEDTLTVDVTRRKVDLLHVPFAGYTPDSMIYIRVLDFEAGTTDDISRYEYVDDTIDPHQDYYYYVESISMGGVREKFTPTYQAPAKIQAAEEDVTDDSAEDSEG